MKNLFKTLMPYKYTALLVLLLMAGQAFCEMNLPAYTQALIDTGIQNRGIEHIVPEAITQEEYLEAERYMTDEEKSLWEGAFENADDGVYHRKALDEGWLAIFDDAGCVISTPTCGPCLGGHMGILAAGERCVSTTNRNFVGRMGHVESEVILSGVPVAVASAVMGRVATPDEI